jgi:hypothetical protein
VVFTVSYFHLTITNDQNFEMQEKKGFLHALVFFIDWNGCTTILTSASLLRSSSFENKIIENLRVGASNYSVIPVILMYC